jgi:hypothetical protein
MEALAGALLRQRYGDPLRPEAVAFVLRQHGRMTDYLRLGITFVAFVFEWWGGRRFTRAGPEARLARIEAWRRSRLSFRRDFLRFNESLLALARFSQASGQERGAP